MIVGKRRLNANATPFPITLTQLTVLTRRSASSADTSPLRYSTVDVVGIRPSANPRGTIEDRFRLAWRSNGISFPPQSRYRGLDPSLRSEEHTSEIQSLMR